MQALMKPLVKEGKFRVAWNPELGNFIQTLVPFLRGQVIAEGEGLILRVAHLHSVQIKPFAHLWDPKFVGLIAHSCDPNIMFDTHNWEFRTLRPIGLGEMLTQDYEQTEDVLVQPFDCACGSANCRGRIIGRQAR